MDGWLRQLLGGRERIVVAHHENVLGTSLELRLRTRSAAAARAAEARVLIEFERLRAVFSVFDPDSELSRWCAGPPAPTVPSPDLRAVLERADHWRAASGGAFHPAAEALTRLWRQAEARGDAGPDPDARTAVLERLREPPWRWDRAAGTLVRGALPLSLNALAKGYIVDRAADAALEDPRVVGVVVNAGGDLCVRGASAERIGIVDPFRDAENVPPVAVIRVADAAVATSGGGRRGFAVGGRLRSHLIDPRTGEPAACVAAASVVAPRAVDADALATAAAVLTPDETIALAERGDRTACRVTDAHGGVHRSARWGALETER